MAEDAHRRLRPAGPRHSGQQPHRSGADQAQRVEVGLAAPSIQPQCRQARGKQCDPASWRVPIRSPAASRSPTGDGGLDRLVGRPGGAVVDHHDAATGEHPGQGHPARQRGAHRLPDGAEQVDAAVAGAPGVGRRVEAGDHLGLGQQRPHPDRIGADGRRRATAGTAPRGGSGAGRFGWPWADPAPGRGQAEVVARPSLGRTRPDGCPVDGRRVRCATDWPVLRDGTSLVAAILAD